jgi:hypothetical protein
LFKKKDVLDQAIKSNSSPRSPAALDDLWGVSDVTTIG